MIQAILVTGVSYMSCIGITDDVKVYPCRFLDDTINHSVYGPEIVPFYGLNQSDLDNLLEKIQKQKNLDDNEMKILKEQIKKKFNGYLTKYRKLPLYPLYAVMNYLIDNKEPVLLIPQILKAFRAAPTVPEIGSKLLELFGSGEIEIVPLPKTEVDQLIKLRDNPTVKSTDLYFQLLFEIGFLTHANDPPSGNKLWKLKFANDMVKMRFTTMIEDEKIAFCNFNPKHKSNVRKAFNDFWTCILHDGEKKDVTNFNNKLKSLNKTLKDLLWTT